MRKILAVLVLMVVGLVSVFADSGVQSKGYRKHQGCVYTSELEAFQKVASDISFYGIFGYSLKGNIGITLATESEVLGSVLIPEYIKEAVKEGFAYSTYCSDKGTFSKEFQAYRLKDGNILVVELNYIFNKSYSTN